jgi:hypothetical protein
MTSLPRGGTRTAASTKAFICCAFCFVILSAAELMDLAGFSNIFDRVRFFHAGAIGLFKFETVGLFFRGFV